MIIRQEMNRPDQASGIRLELESKSASPTTAPMALEESGATVEALPSSDTHGSVSDPASKRQRASVQRSHAAKTAQPNHGNVVPSTTGDLVLLHQATEALRAGNDPEKAARLLREYERASTSKALDEEALALSIEAAMANQDPHVSDLARRYLATYPKGRFRTLALKATASSPGRGKK